MQDSVLLVENDPSIQDFVGRQTLQAAGYQVHPVQEATSGIAQAIQSSPDVIVADLDLPGLSGKDLLVALSSQGVTTPVILLAKKGMENEIIQGFRLGAADYILWPAREGEVLAAVERIMKQVRERRERDHLAHQLEATNQELQQRVRELTTIFNVAKAVTSITDQSTLFERILQNVVKITGADMGWFLLRAEKSKAFLLAAQHALPAALPVRVNQPWDDGISSLVAMSGESLSLSGEPLKRFKISSLGPSILIVPVKAGGQVIGLISLVRHKDTPFQPSEQHLVEAITDFASISLANTRLFRAIEERAHLQQSLAEVAQTNERVTSELLAKASQELERTLNVQKKALKNLVEDTNLDWSSASQKEFSGLEDSLKSLEIIAAAILPLQGGRAARSSRRLNLNELVRQALAQFQPLANADDISLAVDLPSDDVFMPGDENQVGQALNGLLSNAVKYCNSGGKIQVTVNPAKDNTVMVVIEDSGAGIPAPSLKKIFDGEMLPERSSPQRFGGLGIGMSLIKEIITRHNGKIWVENKAGQGAKFSIAFPAAR